MASPEINSSVPINLVGSIPAGAVAPPLKALDLSPEQVEALPLGASVSHELGVVVFKYPALPEVDINEIRVLGPNLAVVDSLKLTPVNTADGGTTYHVATMDLSPDQSMPLYQLMGERLLSQSSYPELYGERRLPVTTLLAGLEVGSYSAKDHYELIKNACVQLKQCGTSGLCFDYVAYTALKKETDPDLRNALSAIATIVWGTKSEHDEHGKLKTLPTIPDESPSEMGLRAISVAELKALARATNPDQVADTFSLSSIAEQLARAGVTLLTQAEKLSPMERRSIERSVRAVQPDFTFAEVRDGGNTLTITQAHIVDPWASHFPYGATREIPTGPIIQQVFDTSAEGVGRARSAAPKVHTELDRIGGFTVQVHPLTQGGLQETLWNVRQMTDHGLKVAAIQLTPTAPQPQTPQAVRKAIEVELRDAGIPALSPCGWGYDPVHFLGIDSRIGTPQDFADFCAGCHGVGVKVYADLVWNHIEKPHSLLEALGDEMFSNIDTPWGRGLNFDHPIVRQTILQNIVDVARVCDGARIDAAHHVPNYLIAEALAAARRVNPAFEIILEAPERETIKLKDDSRRHILVNQAADVRALFERNREESQSEAAPGFLVRQNFDTAPLALTRVMELVLGVTEAGYVAQFADCKVSTIAAWLNRIGNNGRLVGKLNNHDWLGNANFADPEVKGRQNQGKAAAFLLLGMKPGEIQIWQGDVGSVGENLFRYFTARAEGWLCKIIDYYRKLELGANFPRASDARLVDDAKPRYHLLWPDSRSGDPVYSADLGAHQWLQFQAKVSRLLCDHPVMSRYTRETFFGGHDEEGYLTAIATHKDAPGSAVFMASNITGDAKRVYLPESKAYQVLVASPLDERGSHHHLLVQRDGDGAAFITLPPCNGAWIEYAIAGDMN